ncbi:MAG TPA: trimethylamine methyltransferase family protein [Bacteroidota bacterium]|nr:trimethylamine methyltransferase family protein [Bacteroidota bacterium]
MSVTQAVRFTDATSSVEYTSDPRYKKGAQHPLGVCAFVALVLPCNSSDFLKSYRPIGELIVNNALRPSLKLLNDSLLQQIIQEAYELLEKKGVFVENNEAMKLFGDAGALIDSSTRRVYIPSKLIEHALASAPYSIKVHEANGQKSYDVGGDAVHFDPGSAALWIFDHRTRSERKPVTSDLVLFHRLVQRLENFHFQSTGLISSDVPDKIADCYRLYLAFHYCSKPIVTGTFINEGFKPMFEMLTAVRGGEKQLMEKPLAIFDACPSPPLKWSDLTAQSVIECARAGIPSEIISVPLMGATAPVTLAAALVQLTAENLSGVVLSQVAQAGAPVIFGGSPLSFDLKTANAPMGAIETMMINSAHCQIGKALGLPTHAYMGLSDSKSVDAQAGLETGIGAILAALSGVNVVSGGGMMDFENTQSLEKLVIDDEICGMAYRLLEGVAQRDDPVALRLFDNLENDFLAHPHTLQWFQAEQWYPHILDRRNYGEWDESGKPSLADRASKQVEFLLSEKEVPKLDKDRGEELHRIMDAHARRFGILQLPQISTK